MSRLRSALSRFGALFSKDRREAELADELQAHVDLLVAENLRKGMSLDEAKRAARRDFGGLEQTKEAYREQRNLPFFDSLVQDLRFAFRGLRKSPGFARVAILTLAIGIGATSAVFSVVDRILFRGLPYPHGEELVSFGDKAPFESNEFVLSPDYEDWREKQTPFTAVTSINPGTHDCDLNENDPARLQCAGVEASFLPTFGVQPILGRNFALEEDRPGAAHVALLSYGLWISRYGRDKEVLKKTISLDGKSTQIIGVLPADFEMPYLARFDLLVPQLLDSSRDRGPQARQAILFAFGRLKPGVSVSQATAAMQPLYQESLNYVPPQFRSEVSFRLRPLRDREVGDSRLASWILLGAVLAVLLVACSNIANLLLARATHRQREFAVRVSLGASRFRLVRQALTESLLLGILGGLAGWALSYSLLRLFVSIAPEGIPKLDRAQIDLRVLFFTFGISLIAGFLFGIGPALRLPALEALTGKEIRSTSRSLFRQVLVTLQIAVSMILLACAGLFLRSLWKLQTVALGMETNSVVTAMISLREYRYPQPSQQLQLFERLELRLKHIPGMEAVAVSDSLPPAGRSQATFLSGIEVHGRAKVAEGTGGMIGWRIVTPDYFSALGIPIVRGRNFSDEDRVSSIKPVILSEALAKRILPGEDPIGKSLSFGGTAPIWRSVVGVARDVRNNGLAAPPDPEFYILWKDDPQGFFQNAHFTMRGHFTSAAIAQWVRSEIVTLDPTLPVTFEAMDQRVSQLAARPKFNAMLLSMFAALGVLLAAIGVYGVVNSLVAQGTREIGIRMALGADPRSILRLLLLGMARWTVAGTALGLLGAWFCARFTESLLFEVRARDPILLLLATLVLLLAAFFAAWIPARQAMRVDPVVALRYE